MSALIGLPRWGATPVSSRMNDPRNLRVLDAAFGLVAVIHASAQDISVDQVPRLRAQLLRAVDSVPANIAEGARGTRAQFAHCLRTALGSADEAGTHLRIAYHARALEAATYWRCEAKRAVVCKMLHQLIRAVEEQVARDRNEQARGRSPLS
jgi:four helix bundle protein